MRMVEQSWWWLYDCHHGTKCWLVHKPVCMFFQVAHFMTKQDTNNPIIQYYTYNIHHLVMNNIPVNNEAWKSNSGLDQNCLFWGLYVTWYWVCNTKPVPKNPRVCCSSSRVLNILVRYGLIAAEIKIVGQSHFNLQAYRSVATFSFLAPAPIKKRPSILAFWLQHFWAETG